MKAQAIFVGWGAGAPFPSEYGLTVRDQGKTLVIFWEPYGTTLDAIIAGTWDSYISTFAAAAKTYGGPVMLAPFHEMNGNWDSWDGTVGNNSAAKVIAAWRRVHGLFSSATNVSFAWDVNNDSVPDTAANSIESFYPGSAYVDVVAVDGFNFGNPWQTWAEAFSGVIPRLQAYGKPVYIFSVASAAGTLKPQWITDLGAGVAKYGLSGFIWFNQNKEQDWRVNSDASSLKAFQAIVR
jgi:beta-mannanase